MKKLLHLGGAHSQIPAIKYAIDAGYYVITCDYLPDNPGHKYSHEYYNISTTDMEGVYELAYSKGIDGIASFASDPSAPTVGFVAQKLGLTGPGEHATRVLADKGLFRKMMEKCGLITPRFKIFSATKDALLYLEEQRSPKIIKPVDSSGSKGVYKYHGDGNITHIIKEAFKYSRKSEIIIEDLISSNTSQIQGEGFVENGKLIFTIFGDQKLSAYNPTVPASTSFPTRHSDVNIGKFRDLVKIALQGSDFQNGGLNIEIIEDTNGIFHLIELGPRNGGNFMPQLVEKSVGIDLVQLCVDNAMGKKIKIDSNYFCQPHSQLILHSTKSGKFNSLSFAQNIENHIVYQNIYKNKGDTVIAYRGSQDVIGIAIINKIIAENTDGRTIDINNFVNIKIDET